jgi:hypothetical protein
MNSYKKDQALEQLYQQIIKENYSTNPQLQQHLIQSHDEHGTPSQKMREVAEDPDFAYAFKQFLNGELGKVEQGEDVLYWLKNKKDFLQFMDFIWEETYNH